MQLNLLVLVMEVKLRSPSQKFGIIYGQKGHPGKKITKKTPRLKSLPPTSKSLAENIKHAYIQTSIWKAVIKQDPPCLDPTDFGWSKDGVILTCHYANEHRGASNDPLWLFRRPSLLHFLFLQGWHLDD